MNISAKNEYLKIIDECVKATDSCEINNINSFANKMRCSVPLLNKLNSSNFEF